LAWVRGRFTVAKPALGETPIPEPDPEAEFDMALARAGVVVPPERRAAMMEGFRAWCEMRKLLNEPMPLATEPAFALTQPAGPR